MLTPSEATLTLDKVDSRAKNRPVVRMVVLGSLLQEDRCPKTPVEQSFKVNGAKLMPLQERDNLQLYWDFHTPFSHR